MHIIVYSDGASRSNPGLSGAGAVLMDDQKQVVENLRKFLGTQTNNYAEYQAAILGLTGALKIGATEITLRADSELMIKQLKGEYRVKSPELKVLHEQVMKLLGQFQNVRYLEHIRREQNKLADAEANKAIDEHSKDK